MNDPRGVFGIALTTLMLAVSASHAGDQPSFREVKSAEFVRTASLAAEAFMIDEGSCPPADGVVTTDEIADLLEPTYVATLPRFDAWGNPLRYWISEDGCWVASFGPDGVPDDDTRSGDDIRFKNGKPTEE